VDSLDEDAVRRVKQKWRRGSKAQVGVEASKGKKTPSKQSRVSRRGEKGWGGTLTLPRRTACPWMKHALVKNRARQSGRGGTCVQKISVAGKVEARGN